MNDGAENRGTMRGGGLSLSVFKSGKAGNELDGCACGGRLRVRFIH